MLRQIQVVVYLGPGLRSNGLPAIYAFKLILPVASVANNSTRRQTELDRYRFIPDEPCRIRFGRMLEACSEDYGDEEGQGRLIHSKRWVKLILAVASDANYSTHREPELDGYNLVPDAPCRIRFGRLSRVSSSKKQTGGPKKNDKKAAGRRKS
jgi:hypothetical protein